MTTDDEEEEANIIAYNNNDDDAEDGTNSNTMMNNFRDHGSLLMGRILACCGLVKTATTTTNNNCSDALLPDHPSQEEDTASSSIPSRVAAQKTISKEGHVIHNEEEEEVNSYETAAFQLLLKRKSSKPRGRQTTPTYTRIRHIRQNDTWDCGIACLLMVLVWLRDDDDSDTSTPLSPLLLNMERKLLLENVSTQSIWTIDLVILLENILKENDNKNNNNKQQQRQQPNHNNTTYLFVSQVVGVNDQHSTTGYYEKAFADDSTRVNQLCNDVNRLQLPVLWPYRLKFYHQFIDLVSHHHCIAILLVDNSILTAATEAAAATLSNDNKHHNNNNNKSSKQHQDTYAGHYIIICGISREPDHLIQACNNNTNKIENNTVGERNLGSNNTATKKDDTEEEEEQGQSIKEEEEDPLDDDDDDYCIAVINPGISESIIFVQPQKLEQAWRADGTDCDVIFIAKHPPS